MRQSCKSFTCQLFFAATALATVAGCAQQARQTSAAQIPVKSEPPLLARLPYVQSVTGGTATIRWKMAKPTPFTFEAKSAGVPAPAQSTGDPSSPVVHLGGLQ